MVFQSYIFLLVLLPLTIVTYFLCRHRNHPLWAKGILLAASLLFYGWASPVCLLLLSGELLVSFFLGRALAESKHRGLLILGVTFHLSVLIIFKYTGFFIENINAFWNSNLSAPSLILPLGLSFFTFQQIFYLKDIYDGEAMADSLLDYALFLTFFPTVSSGPITRAKEMLPQWNDPSRFRYDADHFSSGLYCFTLGLGKKVLLAETFAGGANYGFANLGSLDSTTAAMAILCYTFQIYFDFSGYCDMGMGICKMLNFDLPINFDSPYRAVSISEFWARWHITLSRFFRTCVYIPLGGNRKGLLSTCRNMMIIFLLSGLWHGAGWTFLLWGGLHGAAMVIDRLCRGKINIPKPIGWVLTFVFVNVAWVYFRAPSVTDGNALLAALLAGHFTAPNIGFAVALTMPEVDAVFQFCAMFAPNFTARLTQWVPILMFPLAFGLIAWVPNPVRQMQRFKPTLLKSLVCIVALVWCVVSFSGVSSFVYANF